MTLGFRKSSFRLWRRLASCYKSCGKFAAYSNAGSVLPFRHSALDGHSASIQIKTDAETPENLNRVRKVFDEISRWHKVEALLSSKGGDRRSNAKKDFKAAKHNQQFMAKLLKYAANLTNDVGKSWGPETIIVRGPSMLKYSSAMKCMRQTKSTPQP